MSLERSTPPNLSTLTSILEAYSRHSGQSAQAHVRVELGELTELALTNFSGNYIANPSLVQELMLAANALISSEDLPSHCDIRLETVQVDRADLQPGEDDSLSSGSVSQQLGDPGDLDAVPHAKNNGLALRQALLARGHTRGYSVQEIDHSVEMRDGKTLPELRFYRTMVRAGKIAEGPHGDIFSSPIAADFGAQRFAHAPLQLAVPTPEDVVQPKLTHKYWVEIAHDASTLYAIDLAPGASGEIGQIIARSSKTAQAPYLQAHSLAQFVTGDWTETVSVDSQAEPDNGMVWQTISSVLEPTPETAPPTESSTNQKNTVLPESTNNPHVGLVEEVEQTATPRSKEVAKRKSNEVHLTQDTAPQDYIDFQLERNYMPKKKENSKIPSATKDESKADQASVKHEKQQEIKNSPPEFPAHLLEKPAEYRPTRARRAEPAAKERSLMKGLRKFFLG
ncbi:hypothetical protein [uncultured Rothia sp.]|uniref:hypothetical protein n=1 Tax=uncultured Rothia sp. TaxID=316088 RepID=UPI0032168924